MSIMIPIGIRIVINTLSTPLKIRKRMVVSPTLLRHPMNVPTNVRTTTILPTNPGEILLILLCVFKGTLLAVVKWNSLAIYLSPCNLLCRLTYNISLWGKRRRCARHLPRLITKFPKRSEKRAHLNFGGPPSDFSSLAFIKIIIRYNRNRKNTSIYKSKKCLWQIVHFNRDPNAGFNRPLYPAVGKACTFPGEVNSSFRPRSSFGRPSAYGNAALPRADATAFAFASMSNSYSTLTCTTEQALYPRRLNESE